MKTGSGAVSYTHLAGITTLVKINDVVYSKKEDAERNPAADIYVERGVAKVTMHSKPTTTLTDKVYQNPMNTVSYTIRCV